MIGGTTGTGMDTITGIGIGRIATTDIATHAGELM